MHLWGAPISLDPEIGVIVDDRSRISVLEPFTVHAEPCTVDA